MKIDFDVLQALFWSITYILIIVHNITKRTLGIPPIAIALNFAWETIALLQDIFIFHDNSVIHILWFSLDVLIVATYYIFCKPVYFKKQYFIVMYIGFAIALYFVFTLINEGMFLSCFIIDIIMALEYLIYCFNRNFRSSILYICICSAKLIGDFCAWLYYEEFSNIVAIIGIAVLLLNTSCLIIQIIKNGKVWIQYKNA